MAKKRRKRKNGVPICLWRLLAVSILILLLVIGLIIYKKINKEEEHADIGADRAEEQEEGLEFPYMLENGKLEIGSVFQFTGTNPDCNDEECEEVGAIQLLNASEDYLESADIIVRLADGSELVYRVEGIPSGKSVLAFETKNQIYNEKNKVIDITAKTDYSSEASLKEEELSFSIDDAGITVSNISQESLANITIKYHCNVDEMYFGGKCYEGLVESLAAGENVILDAAECYLGEAAVVNVIY